MTALEQFVSPALLRALGWTLLHSLWQGALVAAVLAGALLLLRRQRAEARYAAATAALALVVALAGLTFGLYYTGAWAPAALAPAPAPSAALAAVAAPFAAPAATASRAAATTAVADRSGAAPAASAEVLAGNAAPAGLAARLRLGAQALAHYFDHQLPLLVLAWLLGLLAMSLRLLGGLLYVQRLRRHRVRPLPAGWDERLAVLAARAGLRRPVGLLESALVRVPLVVGHLRPLILLPLGTAAGLSPACLEAILAHELAHVLRRDYLVNLLQTVAEALFFYHPAVWFVAGCVRTERENCCDDTATALVGGDPLRLARALTALAEWTQRPAVAPAPRLALAALNRPGALLLRVRRLVQRRPAAPTLAEGLLAGLLVLGGLSLLGGSVALAGQRAGHRWPAAPEPAGLATAATAADTTKRPAKAAPAPPAAPAAPATPTAPEAAVPPPPPAEERQEVVVKRRIALDRPDDDGADDEDGRPEPRRVRRIVVDSPGRGAQPGPGAGTVVITKDKKGRITDLVVNGQRVDTAPGKGKKGRQRPADEPRVEIVQVLPPNAPARPGFGSDGAPTYRLRREVADDVRREVEQDLRRRRVFRFEMPGLEEPLARAFGEEAGPVRVYRLKEPRGAADRDSRRAELEALRAAERGLSTATAAKGLTAAQRQSVGQELAKVRARLRQVEQAAADAATGFGSRPPRGADVEGELRRRDADARERRQELRERELELEQELLEEGQDRDHAREERDRARQDRDQAREEHDRQRRERDEVLINQLRKDGLIQDRDNFQLRLAPNSLTVNGQEQPAALRDKYLKQYAEATGRPLTGNNSLLLTRNSTRAGRFDPEDGPPPPRPPRAPRALRPGPPMGGGLPAPPAPPRAPRLDPDELRRELRKDGVLGATDKNLTFALSNEGLTVNGKKQPEELAAKYRKLTGHAGDKRFNIVISSQED